MSAREEIQTRLAEFLQSTGMNDVYGVLTGSHGKGRGSYRSVTFCVSRVLDGEVRIYGPKFILVRSNRDEAGTKCDSEDEAIAHIRERYGEFFKKGKKDEIGFE